MPTPRRTTRASGASVFVLSTRGASSQAARWLADKENAADLVGGVSLDDKDHNLAAVLLDLSQSATMRASDDIANQVLGSLKNVGKAHKPSIERANFVVLRSPDVPSMLIETGFITNPERRAAPERSGLPQPARASAIAEGVRTLLHRPAAPGHAGTPAAQDDVRQRSRVSRGSPCRRPASPEHGLSARLLTHRRRSRGVDANHRRADSAMLALKP